MAPFARRPPPCTERARPAPREAGGLCAQGAPGGRALGMCRLPTCRCSPLHQVHLVHVLWRLGLHDVQVTSQGQVLLAQLGVAAGGGVVLVVWVGGWVGWGEGACVGGVVGEWRTCECFEGGVG